MSQVIRAIKKSDEMCCILLNQKLQCRLLSVLMTCITQLGSAGFAALITVYAFMQQRKSDSLIGWKMAGSIALSQVLIQSLKRIVNRPRPFRVIEEIVANNPPKCVYSFPSGHTSTAFVIAFVLAASYPFLSVAFCILACLVGISRIYLGVHYPTDVIIGYLLAYITFWIVCEQIIPRFVMMR